MSERTQGPYTAETHNASYTNRDPSFIVGGDKLAHGHVIAKIFNLGGQERHDTNVNFILKAMNSHDDLVQALDNLVQDFKGLLEDTEETRAITKQAEQLLESLK